MIFSHFQCYVHRENKSLLALQFFVCKRGTLRAQLRRLIPRSLWDSDRQQVLLKIFNVVPCLRLNSNPRPWLSYKRPVSSHLNAIWSSIFVLKQDVHCATLIVGSLCIGP